MQTYVKRPPVTLNCWVCGTPVVKRKNIAIALCKPCREKRNRERTLAAYHRNKALKPRPSKTTRTTVDWIRPRKRPIGKALGVPGSIERVECYQKRIQEGFTVFSEEDESWKNEKKPTNPRSVESAKNKKQSKAEQS